MMSIVVVLVEGCSKSKNSKIRCHVCAPSVTNRGDIRFRKCKNNADLGIVTECDEKSGSCGKIVRSKYDCNCIPDSHV